MADSEERADFLETGVRLHNLRIRTGRANQIKSVYHDLLQARAKLEEDAVGAAAAAAAPGAAAAPVPDDDDESELYADDPAYGMIAGMMAAP